MLEKHQVPLLDLDTHLFDPALVYDTGSVVMYQSLR